MFDTTINEGTNYPDTITVHHHKAPTDESIRLLNEFQEKAAANIIQRITVDSNLVKGEVILRNKYAQCIKEIVLKFNLNGKDFIFVEEVQESDFYSDAKIASRKLIEKFSQTLIEAILVDCSNDFTKYVVPKMLEQANNR